MARVRTWNSEFAFERKLTIQPFGLISPDGINSQGIGITYPSVEIDGIECVSPHQFQSVFVAKVDCASALRGQQLRRSAHDRVRHLFIRRDLQRSVPVVHEHLAPNRIDPRGSAAFILSSKNELIGRWRFYANNEIGAFRSNQSLSLPLHDVSLLFDGIQGFQGSPYSADSNKDQEHRWEVCGTKKAAEVAIRFAGGCYCLLFGCLLIYGDTPGQSFRLRLRRIAGPTLVGLGLAAFLFPPYYEGDCDNKANPPPFLKPFHSADIVSHKYFLTSTTYWDTVIGIGRTQMGNILPAEKQIAVISALVDRNI